MRKFLLLALLWVQVSNAVPFHAAWFDFDPKKIIVEDPNAVILAELPSGDINLKEYRATAKDIETYSENYGVIYGDKKDNPKVPNCTRAEVDAVRLWQTNDVYPEVNRILRNAQHGMIDGKPVSQKYENIILMIASATNCAPEYEGPGVRAETAPDFIFDQYKEGNLLGMRGFTSLSKGKKITEYFEQHSKHRIFVEKARGADFDVFGVSEWPEEKEVLIRPGTVFKVEWKSKATDSKYIEWDFGFDQVSF